MAAKPASSTGGWLSIRGPDKPSVAPSLEVKERAPHVSLTARRRPPLHGMKSRKTGRRSRKKTPSLPPDINLAFVFHHTYRFRTSAGITSQAVGIGGVMGALGTMCTSLNATVRTIFCSFRINKITLWPGSNGDALVDWSQAASANFCREDIWNREIPAGITVTGGTVAKPPARTLAADWVSTGATASTTMFTVTASINTVIDLDVSFGMGVLYTPYSIGIAAGAVGSLYYLALDGPTTNKIVPVALPTTN